MADPASIIANRVGGLRERKFEFTQERANITDALKTQQEARAQALAEKTLAIEASKLQRQTQADLDASDFLKHFQNVHPGPDYESQRDQLTALYPFAGHDETVRSLVQDKNGAQNTYRETTKSGGAYDFPEGPSRNTFHKVFQSTGDINQARAAAKQDVEGIKAVREARAQGYLTNEDFATPEGQPLPKTFNSDGSINYQYAQDLAAERAGKTTGKVTKAEDLGLKTAQSYVTSYLTNREKMVEEDPNAAELYKIYSQQLLDHARAGTTPTPTATGAPASTQPSGPTISTPKSVVTAEDYAALAPGEPFISNGRLGKKPAK